MDRSALFSQEVQIMSKIYLKVLKVILLQSSTIHFVLENHFSDSRDLHSDDDRVWDEL